MARELKGRKVWIPLAVSTYRLPVDRKGDRIARSFASESRHQTRSAAASSSQRMAETEAILREHGDDYCRNGRSKLFRWFCAPFIAELKRTNATDSEIASTATWLQEVEYAALRRKPLSEYRVFLANVQQAAPNVPGGFRKFMSLLPSTSDSLYDMDWMKSVVLPNLAAESLRIDTTSRISEEWTDARRREEILLAFGPPPPVSDIAMSGAAACPLCGTITEYGARTAQMRSSDEGMIALYECSKKSCGQKWTRSN